MENMLVYMTMSLHYYENFKIGTLTYGGIGTTNMQGVTFETVQYLHKGLSVLVCKLIHLRRDSQRSYTYGKLEPAQLKAIFDRRINALDIIINRYKGHCGAYFILRSMQLVIERLYKDLDVLHDRFY